MATRQQQAARQRQAQAQQKQAQQKQAQTQTTAAQSGHSIFQTLVFEFVGVSALAVIANANEKIGRVLVWLMIGFLLVWFLLHSSTISGFVQRAVPQTRTGTGTA